MPLYQHRFQGSLPAGDRFVWSWWATSIRSTTDAQAAAVAWLTAFAGAADGLQDKTTPGVSVDKVSTGMIDTATGQQLQVAETVVFFPGTGATPTIPQEVALVVSLRTALANRRGRGRFYLPCLSTSCLTTTGRVSAATITDLMAALNTAWAAYNTGLDVPVVYSRTNRATAAITSFDIGDVWDIQTRRDNDLVQARTSLAMPA